MHPLGEDFELSFHPTDGVAPAPLECLGFEGGDDFIGEVGGSILNRVHVLAGDLTLSAGFEGAGVALGEPFGVADLALHRPIGHARRHSDRGGDAA